MAMSARPLGWIEMAVTGQGASVHRLYPVFGCDQNFTDGSGSLSHDPNVPENNVMVAYHLCRFCGIKDTNSAFRNVEITVVLVVCTSPGSLMTRSLSGVRVNPRW